MFMIDKLLAGRPELRTHFIQRAADASVSGDMLVREMNDAGLAAKRSSVFGWMKRYRVASRHRPSGLAGRVAAAVLKLESKPLHALAARLPKVPPAGCEDTQPHGLAGRVTSAVLKLGRKRLIALARELRVSGLNDA